MNKKPNTSFIIDKKKTNKKLNELIHEDPNLNSRTDLSVRLGFSVSALGNMLNRGNMSYFMLRKLKNAYGCQMSDFEPDPEPAKPVQEQMAIEPSELKPQSDDHDFDAQTNRLFELLESIDRNLKQVLAITPGVMDVQIAIRDGLKEAKGQMWKDMMKDIRGAAFAANLEALKRHDEMAKEVYHG